MPQRVPPCGRTGTRGVDAPGAASGQRSVLSAWHACMISGLSARVPGLLEPHQLLPLRWRQQGPNPQHDLQALFAGCQLQSANSVGLLHHRSFVRHLLGEQRAHLGIRLAQFYPAASPACARDASTSVRIVVRVSGRGPAAPHTLAMNRSGCALVSRDGLSAPARLTPGAVSTVSSTHTTRDLDGGAYMHNISFIRLGACRSFIVNPTPRALRLESVH